MNLYADCNNLTPIDFSISNLECAVGREQLDTDISELTFANNFLKSKAFDAIILGAGVHGCTVACHLKSKFPKFKILLIDENDFLCEQFFNRTNNIGQKTLRSPYQHHIAPDYAMQLIDFARLNSEYMSGLERKQLESAITGQRSIVPLDIFWAHVKHTLLKYNIRQNTFKSRISTIKKTSDGYDVLTNGGKIKAKYIIQATGSIPFMPEFVPAELNSKVNYAYDIDINKFEGKTIAIIGNGLTAATLIKSLHLKNKIIWVNRRHEVYKCTDVLPKYFRTEGVSEFQRLTCDEKRKILEKENSASIMPEYKQFIEQLESSGKLEIYRNTKDIRLSKNPTLSVQLDSLLDLRSDAIILATGLKVHEPIFQTGRGFNDNLELLEAPNFYATGKIVENVIGPAAKNFDGARIATKRIISDISSKESKRKILVEYNPKGTLAIR